MILLASVIIFSNILTATVSATIFDDYCFRSKDMENSFCYETQKACENGRKNDPMAESKCYTAID